MQKKNNIGLEVKKSMHPRNKHRGQYDFPKLIQTCPELRPYVALNTYGNESIDFSNSNAVRMLNKALLKEFYKTDCWELPQGYLCPPIPGRADYIHYMADVLAWSNKGVIPTGSNIRVLDIGLGANCIYPILGHAEYGWSFVGTDIDPKALQVAQQIISANKPLNNFVECRLQPNPEAIFKGIFKSDEKFDFTMCNPPFHESEAAAKAVSDLKWRKLGIKKDSVNNLNFGGRQSELWCKGGEEAFVKQMILESAEIPDRCLWFSSLVSKKETLNAVYGILKRTAVREVRTIDMAQGQKKSRLLLWSFMDGEKQKKWY
jgi:23S rRNA (adenine1618-N6)-methyltransferase